MVPNASISNLYYWTAPEIVVYVSFVPWHQPCPPGNRLWLFDGFSPLSDCGRCDKMQTKSLYEEFQSNVTQYYVNPGGMLQKTFSSTFYIHLNKGYIILQSIFHFCKEYFISKNEILLLEIIDYNKIFFWKETVLCQNNIFIKCTLQKLYIICRNKINLVEIMTEMKYSLHE